MSWDAFAYGFTDRLPPWATRQKLVSPSCHACTAASQVLAGEAGFEPADACRLCAGFPAGAEKSARAGVLANPVFRDRCLYQFGYSPMVPVFPGCLGTADWT